MPLVWSAQRISCEGAGRARESGDVVESVEARVVKRAIRGVCVRCAHIEGAVRKSVRVVRLNMAAVGCGEA